MSSSPPLLIATEPSTDGLLVATIDMPGRSMNVFSEALMDALEALIDQVAADHSIKGVVVTSGKSSFLAGADLPMVRGMTALAQTATHNEMFAHCGRIGRLFLRMEQSVKPWVAAVNGTALGGGLELAMACRARLIDPLCKALIGLPEVKLGLLPGAGGTQRLPRFVGLDLGLDLLLSGRSLNPAQAIQAGLFEACPPNTPLLDAALLRLKNLMIERPGDPGQKYPDLSLPSLQDNETAVQALAERHGISQKALADYPAYRAILRSVLAGAGLDLPAACDAEMTRFLDLMFNPVADHMISTLFIERQRVEKAVQHMATTPPTQIRSGALGPQNVDWQALLSQSGITLIGDTSLEANVIELDHAACGTPIHLRLREVHEHEDAPQKGVNSHPSSLAPGLILSRSSEHGRVIECLLPQANAMWAPDRLAAIKGVLASLAKKSKCFLFFTNTPSYTAPQSLLLALQRAKPLDKAYDSGGDQDISALKDPLEAMALSAAQALEEGRISDPGIIDVAAVLAGIAPAFSGGPLSYTWSHRDLLNPVLRTRLGASFESFERKLQAYQKSKLSSIKE